jgi:hypothetical protein
MTRHVIRSGRTLRQRPLTLECLERRAMLAGNVNVFVSGGNLFIRGDNAGNGVLVEQVGDGEYAVIGFTWEGAPTRINGDPDGVEVVDGVTGNIDVDLKSGNDALGVGNDSAALIAMAEECGFSLDGLSGDTITPTVNGALEVPRDLIIKMGNGEDGVAVMADVDRDAIINTGNHDDGVAVGDSSFGDDLIILTGDGEDGVCVHSSFIDDHLNIQTGDHNDNVEVVGVADETPPDELQIEQVGLVDAGHILILTGSGSDSVLLENVFSEREVIIDTGSGADSVDMQNFDIGDDLIVHTGSGMDRVEVEAGDIGDDLVIHTGDHDDTVAVGAFSADDVITVLLGSGNDELTLVDFDAADVLVDTGSGNDGSPTAGSPITVAEAHIFGDLTILTGDGNDLVAVSDVTAEDDLVLNLGSGNDEASLVDLVLGDDLTAVLGSGMDDLLLNNVDVDDRAFIDAGSGDDTVTIEASSAAEARILMGSGNNDRLTINASSVTGLAFLRGGPGNNDTLEIVVSTFGDLDEDEFENVLIVT